VSEWFERFGNIPALLHHRHYGDAFRQLLDATSKLQGNLIEDAVEELFLEYQVPYIRTGSHTQGHIAERFELTVQPAPGFVAFDECDTLRALLACKRLVGSEAGAVAIDRSAGSRPGRCWRLSAPGPGPADGRPRSPRFQPPPIEPGVRFSRTRLTDVLHRRCSTGARQARLGLGA